MNFRGLTLTGNYGDRFKSAQNTLDSEVIKRLEDYTPVAMDKYPNHGKMSRSHRADSPGTVINTEPKARREYYINKGFSGGKRGKMWLERMKTDQKNDIIRAVSEAFR